MQPLLTEAARRSLTRASRLAEKSGANDVKPEHLLHSLLLEESKAVEILTEFGVDIQSISTIGVMDAFTEDGTPSKKEYAADEFQQSDSLRQVIVEAGHQAGRGTEIGSDHLLWGLTTVDSPTAAVLQQHNLTPETLASRLTGFADSIGEPLEVDIHFNWKRTSPQTESRHSSVTSGTLNDLLRVLDAAANRAREGLRVLEDFVRFTLDDTHLSRLLKNSRHELTKAMKQIDPVELLRSRDTQQDVGTRITTAAETARNSLPEVVQANFKRVQEATRTLEEFGKVLSPSIGETIEGIRYRLYTLEKAVLLTQTNRERLEGRNLYLLVTSELCQQGIETVVRESTAAGVGIVQLREKSLSDRELVKLAKRIREWTRETDTLFIMNDRPDLAVLADADGIHVGQDELSVHEARRLVGPNRLVGVSTHTIEQARKAVLDGADYLGVGPVFPSMTKQFDQFVGLDFVRSVESEITRPWFVIGGINTENMQQVLDAGANRVAVSGAICTAENPAEAARQLIEQPS
jgi:thiamine-phosphate pyrophosphorylase